MTSETLLIVNGDGAAGALEAAGLVGKGPGAKVADARRLVVLRDVLSSLKDGERTVVMVTHNLRQGLELANRIAIQVRGRLAWQGEGGHVDVDGFEHHYHQVVEDGHP